mmetsp:Transcript_25842/g.72385  ORF Transcript_25842/g.72385 Transcript_25842/m.72385 type:complete len:237 (+) Transcript_25842:328-1038(+)
MVKTSSALFSPLTSCMPTLKADALPALFLKCLADGFDTLAVDVKVAVTDPRGAAVLHKVPVAPREVELDIVNEPKGWALVLSVKVGVGLFDDCWGETVWLHALDHFTELGHGLCLGDRLLPPTAFLRVVGPLGNVVGQVVCLLRGADAVGVWRAQAELLSAVDVLNPYRFWARSPANVKEGPNGKDGATVECQLPTRDPGVAFALGLLSCADNEPRLPAGSGRATLVSSCQRLGGR